MIKSIITILDIIKIEKLFDTQHVIRDLLMYVYHIPDNMKGICMIIEFSCPFYQVEC
jgi:hypothetical protein